MVFTEDLDFGHLGYQDVEIHLSVEDVFDEMDDDDKRKMLKLLNKDLGTNKDYLVLKLPFKHADQYIKLEALLKEHFNINIKDVEVV